MSQIDWNKEFSRSGPRIELAGLAIAMHCHHYNINLQRMLEQSLGEPGIQLIFAAAEKSSYKGLMAFLKKYPKIRTVKSKLEFGATIYRNCGLGLLHFQHIDIEGGEIICPSSHHVTGWLAKHGRRDTPGCHYARGWLAGFMSVLFELPVGSYDVQEATCKMMRDEFCTFRARRNGYGHRR